MDEQGATAAAGDTTCVESGRDDVTSKGSLEKTERSSGGGSNGDLLPKGNPHASEESSHFQGTPNKLQSMVQIDSGGDVATSNCSGREEACSMGNLVTGDFCLSPQLRELKSRIFAALPQDPHYLPLANYSSIVREGMILGLDLAFVTVFEEIRQLGPHDFASKIEDLTERLSQLEQMGYNVRKLRQHLDNLRGIAERNRASRDAVARLEADARDREAKLHSAEGNVSMLASCVAVLEAEIKRSKAEIESERAIITNRQSEIINLRSEAETLRKHLCNVESEFASAAQSLL
ncbi:DUF724 domain-containing protein 3-like isoform X2 [Magnolia sinica]|nr:DUF724 domain-containing protein 3-like isoform X2 [Magnolia sinica]XP_058092981.1 DUF724 domain-containing protein 3-like isoform X2 [Magnolia sinica]XP_058092982.1 DUF724 domain-containing protein 3-like isoform X2 [Magnolia sinica]XP_058092983.1 DUF724 domain-containing protein 3-like isoform X2 [Magnolia sinica]XP_058092984.1 DUF724 domain-containing protein 3-like isoform X2 [Magnolia sinica]